MRNLLVCLVAAHAAAPEANSGEVPESPPRQLRLLPRLLPLLEAQGFQVAAHGAPRAATLRRESLPAPGAPAQLAEPVAITRAKLPGSTAPRQPDARARSIVMQEKPELLDRVVASSVYLLPILDGFQYGAWIYQNIPPLGAIAYPFAPFVIAFQSVPFLGLILFLGLSFFTGNMGLPRFVRFNIQQAIVLDILLILPALFAPMTRLFPGELQIIGTNLIFYIVVGVVGYSVFSNLRGELPDQVPILSDAANAGIGPL